LSFGHASFFGIGAYVVTLALVYWNITPWLGIPLGMIVAALAAIVIGLPTFRLRGHYFALSMLAYPLAILYFLQYLGFQEMSLPMHRENPAAFLEFANPHNYTLVAVGLLIAAVLVARWSKIPASGSLCWLSGKTNSQPRLLVSTPAYGKCEPSSCPA
jgi:ABC-type branched-subunit amino acid transport system permease subunit